jgi:DNA repair protein RecO (recombination protein O)
VSGLYRATGVVLRTFKLGEADRIIVFCTKERGKVRAVAKGVRKTKSKFGARLEPTNHVAIQCYEGRELDIVTQVDTIDSFKRTREDLDALRRSMALLEAVDHVTQEGDASPRLYQMLVGALKSLNESGSPLIVPTFFWKLLAHEGLHPVLDQCASCGEQQNLVAFDLNEGGTLCNSCRRGPAVSAEALNLLRRTLQGDLARVLKERPNSATFELERLADESMEIHLERRLRSRRFDPSAAI